MENVITLEGVVQIKEEFLSMIVHDLRIPLSAIILSSELLEAEMQPEEASSLGELVETISYSSKRLNKLLEDLLTLYRLEARQLQLKLEIVELADIVRAGVSGLSPLFGEKSQILLVSYLAQDYFVRVDRLRLEQILFNLLVTASKYSSNGGQIRVELQLSNTSVILAITDSGPGIPLEEQSHIFDLCYRHMTRDHGAIIKSNNLELFIAHSLVELHHGQLWVESAVGHGSTFFLKLPLFLD